jgi:hypothetical protein
MWKPWKLASWIAVAGLAWSVGYLYNVKKTAEELAKIAPLIYEKDTLNMKTDSNLFADTHYHLKDNARIISSLELVEQLKPVIETKR